MTIREILRAGADYIEQHGLKKNAYGGRIEDARYVDELPDGPACLVGACATVATVDVRDVEHVIQFVEHATGVIPGVFTWNDTHSQEDVVALMRRMAGRCQ